MPKISVLIPFYNREKYLQATLKSLEKQVYQDFKVIFYDDGSTDKSIRIASAFQIKHPETVILGEKENKGVAYARNKLLSRVDTQYAAWQDSDDIAEPQRFYYQIREMQTTRLDLVQCDSYHCKDELNPYAILHIDPTKYKTGEPKEFWRNACFASSFFKQECAVIKFQEEKREGGEDIRWLSDLVKKEFRLGNVSKPLYRIRNHPNRLTMIREKKRKGQDAYEQFKELTS